MPSGEIAAEKGKLYKRVKLPYIGKQFTMSFKFFINDLSGYAWQSLIHVTTGGDKGKMGFRIPGVWATVNKDLYVIFPLNGNDSSKPVGKVEEQKWMKLELSQKPNKFGTKV